MLLMCRKIPHSIRYSVLGGLYSLLDFRVSSTNLERWTLRMAGSVHIKRSSGTWSSGHFWFLVSFQASKLLTAHLVVLSVFAGVTPLDRAATCSSVTNAAKRVELELPAAVPEVWLVLALRMVVVGGSVVGGLVVGGSVVGVAVVGVVVVTLASAPGQPVHSHRPRQVLENRRAISLSPRNVYVATLFKLLGWAGRPVPCALRVSDHILTCTFDYIPECDILGHVID